ncbi:amino acid permease C-terminal domain-containing protein [Lysinibacillus sphaericus]
MSQLSILTWIACGIWFIIGLIVYLAYGRKNSEMNKQ